MKLLWLVLFLIALCIAWLIGYRMRAQEEKPSKKKHTLPRDYLVGLNFLLNEETDKAVDVFIKMLEVDSDTVETHLAVGNLFRRRGEVDRAIRIHQNLIARPHLEKLYREQALFELGQDYLSAGVLDRAEKIFLELVNEKSHAARALLLLLDIYQQEKDWKNALTTASKYQSVTKKNMQPVIAHYYCELAELAYNKNDDVLAENYLQKASTANAASVRASLLRAKVCMRQYNFKEALINLKRIKEQNPHYLSEAIDLLATCYEKLGQQDELVVYLEQLVNEHPRIPVVLILADRIRQWKGDKVAANFVAEYVRRYPSLRGLYSFVNLYISSVEGRAKEDLHILQKLMKKVLANKPSHKCTSCGFSGKTLHWQCPGCKQWNTMLPIHALEEGVT
jgi:lipopolysaccharide biosynthesis regulator YciM